MSFYGYNPKDYIQDFSWIGDIGQALGATASKMPELIKFNRLLHENKKAKGMTYEALNKFIDSFDESELLQIAPLMGLSNPDGQPINNSEEIRTKLKNQLDSMSPPAPETGLKGEEEDPKMYASKVINGFMVPLVQALGKSPIDQHKLLARFSSRTNNTDLISAAQESEMAKTGRSLETFQAQQGIQNQSALDLHKQKTAFDTGESDKIQANFNEQMKQYGFDGNKPDVVGWIANANVSPDDKVRGVNMLIGAIESEIKAITSSTITSGRGKTPANAVISRDDRIEQSLNISAKMAEIEKMLGDKDLMKTLSDAQKNQMKTRYKSLQKMYNQIDYEFDVSTESPTSNPESVAITAKGALDKKGVVDFLRFVDDNGGNYKKINEYLQENPSYGDYVTKQTGMFGSTKFVLNDKAKQFVDGVTQTPTTEETNEQPKPENTKYAETIFSMLPEKNKVNGSVEAIQAKIDEVGIDKVIQDIGIDSEEFFNLVDPVSFNSLVNTQSAVSDYSGTLSVKSNNNPQKTTDKEDKNLFDIINIKRKKQNKAPLTKTEFNTQLKVLGSSGLKKRYGF